MTDDDAMRGRLVNLVRTGPRGSLPVVLVHPVGLDLTYWSAQIEALGGDHDVVAFDLPGHGRTPGTPADWTLDRAAALLASVVRSLDAGPAHIVGLSVGGMIAQALALDRPESVASLTLIDTAAAFSDAARDGMRARAEATRTGGMAAVLHSTLDRWFTADTMARRPDLIDRVTKTLLSDDPEIHGAMWEMISGLDLVPRIGAVTCPTLILVGEHDPSSPPEAARLLRDHIAGGQMHVIPDTSHMAPLERPDAVNAFLVPFLASLRTTSPPVDAASGPI